MTWVLKRPYSCLTLTWAWGPASWVPFATGFQENKISGALLPSDLSLLKNTDQEPKGYVLILGGSAGIPKTTTKRRDVINGFWYLGEKITAFCQIIVFISWINDVVGVMADRSTKPECSSTGPFGNPHPSSNHDTFLFQHIHYQVISVYLRMSLMHIHDEYYQRGIWIWSHC